MRGRHANVDEFDRGVRALHQALAQRARAGVHDRVRGGRIAARVVLALGRVLHLQQGRQQLRIGLAQVEGVRARVGKQREQEVAVAGVHGAQGERGHGAQLCDGKMPCTAMMKLSAR